MIANSKEDRDSELLNAALCLMKDTYYSIGCIDLDANSMDIIVSTDGKRMDKEYFKQDYRKEIHNYIEIYVLSEYRKRVLDTLRLERLESLFESGADHGEVVYRRFDKGEAKWARSELVPMRQSGTSKRRIMWYERNISSERDLEERLSQKFIRENDIMRRTLSQEEQYRHAILFDSILVYNINLTKDVIEDEIFEIVDGRRIPVLPLVGMSAPCNFTEFAAAWRDRNVAEEDRERFALHYNRDYLLSSYKNGKKEIAFEFSTVVGRNKLIRVRQSVLMITDSESEDILAMCNCKDITAEREAEYEIQEKIRNTNIELKNALDSEQQKMEILSAIGNIYYGMYFIDIAAKKYREITRPQYFHDSLATEGDTDTIFDYWINNVVDRQYRDEVRGFVNLQEVVKRNSRLNISSIDIKSLKVGWIRSSFITVRRDGKGRPTHVLWTGEDIDAVKKAELDAKLALQDAYEAANRANAAKTSFLSNMSHDIRTPMNAIVGMTAIAGTHLEDKDRVADCLSKITVASKHLLALINEILDMSKIESGKADLILEEFNLADLVDNLLVMSKPQVEKKKHSLTVNIKSIEHENVIGDSRRIQQVFMNLMSNAVKYTPEGGKIQLTISENPTNREKIGCYEFVFEDNGIGMDEEFLEHIFEPFSRANDGIVEKMQGTGLGMAITKNIVQMMNGDIKVESKKGEGTRFTVNIFLELQDVNENSKLEDLVDLPVLVVDDDRISCEAVCQVLGELGIMGEWVLTGKEAVSRVAERHESGEDFFAIIIDWKMPEMDGLATTKAIRSAIGGKTPIIIISTYDWSDIEQEARAAGANAFVGKPLFKSRVLHLFRELTGKGQKKEEALEDKFEEVDFSGKRALLAEDNELNAEIASEILGMVGIEVNWVDNGKKAVDIMAEAEEGFYDIIFMDIQMPVMDGYEAAQAIRALSGDYPKRIPIVAMTANAFADDVQSAKKAGMNEHIAKPLDLNQLLKVLKKWL